MRKLVEATFKTGIGTVLSLLMGIAVTKIMAVVLGPSGVGLYSLLRQTVIFSNGLGTMGGGTALVQGLASREGEARNDYLATTFWLFALGALLVSGALLALAPWISLWVLGDTEGQNANLVRGLSLPVALGVISAYLYGLLNGFRAIGTLALVQVLCAASTLVLAYPVSRLAEVGYPIAFVVMMAASQIVVVAVGARRALREGWLTPLLSHPRVSLRSESLKHFFSFAGVTSVALLVNLGVVLVVRALIAQNYGLDAAGIFDVAWTLSMTYIMLILASFGTYYLPTLSRTDDLSDRILLIQQVVRLTTLLMVPLITGVIVLKPLVVELLYSDEFAPALEIVRWMLVGDYFKVAAYVIGMPLLAYADMRVFFWTEMLWNAGFVGFAALAIYGFGGAQGIGAGFLLMYVVILSCYVRYVRRRHRLPLTRKMVLPWLAGLALVVGASLSTWSDAWVNWLEAVLWMAATVVFSWLLVTRSERKELLRMVMRKNA